MGKREPYVKPIVLQMHYSSERGVTIAGACKTVGSTSGPTVEGCLTDTSPSFPCVETGT